MLVPVGPSYTAASSATLEPDPLYGVADGIFAEESVLRLLEKCLSTRRGRFRIFCALAEHEAEGVRFLSAADRLGADTFRRWNHREHLRDERRHVAYFSGLACGELTGTRPAVDTSPLSPAELSVLESPQSFLISLYVAERFSASYLRALRSTLPAGEGDRMRAVEAVLMRALADEEKHARWVLSAVDGAAEETVRAQMREHWCELEVAFFARHAESLAET